MDRKKLYFTAAGIGAGLIMRGVLRKPAGLDLYSKVVLITGRLGGLGAAVAQEFAALGCQLALAGNDPTELDELCGELESRRVRVFSTRADVTNLAQMDGAAEAVISRYGRIDILVNNAGRMDSPDSESISLDAVERAMDAIFWSIVYPTRAALPYMMDRRSGRIVNIIPWSAKPAPGLLPGNTARYAAIGFSEGLRAELLPEGISVVTIVPDTAGSNQLRTARHIVTAAERGEANGLSPLSLHR